jgi:hypothetical protein
MTARTSGACAKRCRSLLRVASSSVSPRASRSVTSALPSAPRASPWIARIHARRLPPGLAPPLRWVPASPAGARVSSGVQSGDAGGLRCSWRRACRTMGRVYVGWLVSVLDFRGPSPLWVQTCLDAVPAPASQASRLVWTHQIKCSRTSATFFRTLATCPSGPSCIRINCSRRPSRRAPKVVASTSWVAVWSLLLDTRQREGGVA